MAFQEKTIILQSFETYRMVNIENNINRVVATSALLLSLIVIMSMPAQGQEIEWNVKSTGFFDNLEYPTPYRDSKTMDGLWLQPSVALRWDEKHSLHAGFGGRAEWGDEKNFVDPTLELYYEYSTSPLRFLFGSFSRDEMRGDWPTALISDSVRYYDPMMEGFLFQHSKGESYVEAFVDWTGARTKQRREQFMAGGSGLLAHRVWQLGFQGYYYHYARKWDSPADEYVRDYAVVNLFAGLNLSRLTPLDSLVVRVGVLSDIERNRQFMSHWDVNPGLFFETTATWHNLYLKNTLYAGRGQQVSGIEGIGQWYWADPFYRSKVYDRTDFLFRFVRNRYVNAYLGAATHFDDKGKFSWQQRITLALNIGNMKHKHQRTPF